MRTIVFSAVLILMLLMLFSEMWWLCGCVVSKVLGTLWHSLVYGTVIRDSFHALP